MQKLLIILTVLFLFILAPAFLIALATPERLGSILVLWIAVAAVAGGIVWYRVRCHRIDKEVRPSQPVLVQRGRLSLLQYVVT